MIRKHRRYENKREFDVDTDHRLDMTFPFIYITRTNNDLNI